MKQGVAITCKSGSGRQVVLTNCCPLSPYWIDDVDGIDGAENTINTVKGSGQAGETFISMTPDKRTLTIRGKLLQADDDTRIALKKAFNIRYNGQMTYQYKGFTAYINYYVKKGVTFSDESERTFSVTLECPDPYFKVGDGVSETWTEIAAWSGGVEFDFEIPDEGKGFEERAQSLVKNIYNDGDSEVGIKIKFTATGDTSNPSLTHIGLQQYIEVSIDMQAGDVIIVSTGFGKKSAKLTRGGVTTNIFNKIKKGSTWLQMQPGDNLLRYNADPIDNVDVSLAAEILLEVLP